MHKNPYTEFSDVSVVAAALKCGLSGGQSPPGSAPLHWSSSGCTARRGHLVVQVPSAGSVTAQHRRRLDQATRTKICDRWPRKPGAPRESGLGRILLGGKVLERNRGVGANPDRGKPHHYRCCSTANPTVKQGLAGRSHYLVPMISHVRATKAIPSLGGFVDLDFVFNIGSWLVFILRWDVFSPLAILLRRGSGQKRHYAVFHWFSPDCGKYCQSWLPTRGSLSTCPFARVHQMSSPGTVIVWKCPIQLPRMVRPTSTSSPS
jgi:hypothetical protein